MKYWSSSKWRDFAIYYLWLQRVIRPVYAFSVTKRLFKYQSGDRCWLVDAQVRRVDPDLYFSPGLKRLAPVLRWSEVNK